MIIEEEIYNKLPENIKKLFKKELNPSKDEVVGAFPITGTTDGNNSFNAIRGNRPARGYTDPASSAARFFYSAKASKEDRAFSKHPTVKPVKLIQYLVKLITPPNGIVLDPFAGTGTTGQAAFFEDKKCILIERETEYQEDINRRMNMIENGELKPKEETPKKNKKTSSKKENELNF